MPRVAPFLLIASVHCHGYACSTDCFTPTTALRAGDAELQSALQQRRQWQQQAEAGQQQVSQLRQELAGTAQAPQQHEAASSAMPSSHAGQAAQLHAAENEVLRLRLELENSQAAMVR